jgi:amino acid transporter
MPALERRITLLPATALNMSNMIGIGPFITIPLLMTGLGGPQALAGWAVALVIVMADGLIWSELGAAMPGSGGTYQYLREGFGPRYGRLMGFLFIWQFILSGPLEIASGYIGFANYAR